MVIQAPVVVIVEAKKGDLTSGMGQCIAEMVAAQKFNQQTGKEISTIFGSVTTGSLWRFLQLENHTVTFDLREYAMPPVDRLLSILVQMVSQESQTEN